MIRTVDIKEVIQAMDKKVLIFGVGGFVGA
jgi:hypothetical protein